MLDSGEYFLVLSNHGDTKYQKVPQQNMADATKKVIADVPDELRDEIDDLGTKLDLRMSQMVREALERTIPVWRQRAVERAKAALSPVFGSVATAAAVDGEAKAGDSFK